MAWIADVRYAAGGYWLCRVRRNEVDRARYEHWTGRRYNRKLLMGRRHKALVRQRARHEAVA